LGILQFVLVFSSPMGAFYFGTAIVPSSVGVVIIRKSQT